MAENFWVKLHITAGGTINAVEQALKADKAVAFPQGGVELGLFRNKQFQPYRFGMPYDFLDNSNAFIEVDLQSGAGLSEDDLVSGVIRLTSALRARNWVVTVTGSPNDIEEKVIAATGWNWTEDNPTPPGWAD